ncbi:MAG: hypothetical protein GTN53_01005 [Candidatus Aminicenantes bacterium]|nr:hypothetical protein [Candidatus Aminicenantes bacterium]NIQ65793.1 hypothetical protein [Candidatus Aminicenantes bacterium]NIT21075.1 hypothetical protein [Candidatus Aminicenantes bacterium]
MAYETLISVEFVEKHTIDSHIWVLEGVEYVVIGGISIYNIDDEILAAILVSLFSDRRVPFDGDPPLTPGDRRGWWGDNTLEPNDRIGSRLWTLGRYKFVNEQVETEAEEIINEALQWMLTDGVAENIFIKITRPDNYTFIFEITIKRPGIEKLGKYQFAWKITGNIIGA